MSEKIYSQDELDTFKAQARLEGKLEGFLLNVEENLDHSKFLEIAKGLELAIAKYGDSLPHDAAIAAEMVDTALKMMIHAMEHA